MCCGCLRVLRPRVLPYTSRGSRPAGARRPPAEVSFRTVLIDSRPVDGALRHSISVPFVGWHGDSKLRARCLWSWRARTYQHAHVSRILPGTFPATCLLISSGAAAAATAAATTSTTTTKAGAAGSAVFLSLGALGALLPLAAFLVLPLFLVVLRRLLLLLLRLPSGIYLRPGWYLRAYVHHFKSMVGGTECGK